MRLFGIEITRAKQLPQSFGDGRSIWGLITEPFTGAWQRNIVAESKQNLLAFSAVYACTTLISGDVSKLRMKLMQQDEDGIWTEVRGNSPFWPVLRRPNEYQTIVQFLEQWVISKLLWGNTYVYLRRDNRNIPVRMYVLDPRLVVPKVTEDGTVYYGLKADRLSQIDVEIIVPSEDIMHDRAACLFHPLCGVSPIYACASSATQGIRIQYNSAKFFENMSRPSGMLTSPDKITNQKAQELKAQFEQAMSGGNVGRLLVAGDGLKYEPITMNATDAQLIEQLKWTIEDVARCFHVPLHKIGAGVGTPFANVASLNQDYYSQTLQVLIESIEALLNAQLGIADAEGKTYSVELDLEGLLRMDPLSRAERHAKLVGAGIEAPNEARAGEDLKPVKGGETPYLQQQNWPLDVLAEREPPTVTAAGALPKPAAATPALPPPAVEDQAASKWLTELYRGLEELRY